MADQIAKLIFQADTQAIKAAKTALEGLNTTARTTTTAVDASNKVLAKQAALLKTEASAIKKVTAEEKAAEQAKKSVIKAAKLKNAEQAKTARLAKKAAAEVTRMANAEKRAAVAAERLAAKQKKAAQASVKLSKKSKVATKEATKLEHALRRASNASAILTGPLGGVSGRLSFLATGLSKFSFATLAAGVAFAGFATVIGKSLASFASYETQMFKLEALTKATGFRAGFTADQLDKMATAVGRNTLASADGIRDVQGILLSFGSITGDVFKRTIAASVDLAAVMGITTVGAAKTLAKALDDPINRLTSMGRAGITFTQVEKDKITALVKSNKKLEAQAIILEKVESRLKGAGTGGGLAGQVDLLAENVTRLGIELTKTSGIGDATTIIFGKMARFAGVAADVVAEMKASEGEVLFALRKRLENTEKLLDQQHKIQNSKEKEDQNSGRINELQERRLSLLKEMEPLEAKLAEHKKAVAEGGGELPDEELTLKESQQPDRLAIETALLQVSLDERLGLKRKAAEDEYALALRASKLDHDLEVEKNPLLLDELKARKEATDEIALQEMDEKLMKAYLFEEGEIAKTTLIQAELLRRSGFTEEANALEIEALLMQNDLKFEAMEESYRRSEEGLLAHKTNEDKIIADQDKRMQDADKIRLKIVKDGKKQAKKEAFDSLAILATNSKKAFKINKMASLANAVVKTAEGVAAGVKLGWPLAVPAVAYALSTGGAQIAAIKATQFGGGGGGISAGGGGGGISAGSAAASSPVQEAANDDLQSAPSVVNLTIDGAIDPSGARRIIEAINEATEDGLEINALVGT